MSALLVGGASTFVSCKDYDGDQAAVTNANVKGLSDKLQEQITALENLKTDINTKLDGKADQSVVDALNTKVDNAITALNERIDAIKSCECPSLDDLKAIFAEQAFVNSINSDLTALSEKVGDINTKVGAIYTLLGSNLENAVTKTDLADYAKSADLEDYARKADLDGYLKTDNFSGQLVSTLNTLLETAGLENITDVNALFAEIDKIAAMNEAI